MVRSSFIKEACIDSVSQAILAEKKGADQIEFCSNLDLDGLTPELAIVKDLLTSLTIPVKLMIRPREGDFYYSDHEIDGMIQQIGNFMDLDFNQFVVGLLDENAKIDEKGLTKIVSKFESAHFCFHKAIDASNDILQSLKTLNKYPQITSILSSGGYETAWTGRKMLKLMLQNCSDHITLIVAGKVTNENIDILHRKIGARCYHGRKIVGELEK